MRSRPKRCARGGFGGEALVFWGEPRARTRVGPEAETLAVLSLRCAASGGDERLKRDARVHSATGFAGVNGSPQPGAGPCEFALN
jgi:hypothetical protein